MSDITKKERVSSERRSKPVLFRVHYSPHYVGHHKQKEEAKQNNIEFYNSTLQKT